MVQTIFTSDYVNCVFSQEMLNNQQIAKQRFHPRRSGSRKVRLSLNRNYVIIA